MLSGRAHFTVKSCTPDQLPSYSNEHGDTPFDLLIADLTAYGEKPAEVIVFLMQLELSSNLLVIHRYTSPHLIAPLLDAGANGYLPSDMTEQDILTAIDEISGGNRYPRL